MKAASRTFAVGLAAAVLALGGGALVADAANHASFASSATQDSPGGFGRLGQPPDAIRMSASRSATTLGP